MELSTILQDTRKAFENNECYELLTGQKEYGLAVPDLPIPIPTDWARVIPRGVHELFAQTKDEKILEQYEQAIVKLLEEGKEKVWIAAYVIFVQLDTEYNKKASFYLNRKVFPLFHDAVANNKDYLESQQCGWGGMNYYQDIARMNQILWEDYGINMLP